MQLTNIIRCESTKNLLFPRIEVDTFRLSHSLDYMVIVVGKVLSVFTMKHELNQSVELPCKPKDIQIVNSSVIMRLEDRSLRVFNIKIASGRMVLGRVQLAQSCDKFCFHPSRKRMIVMDGKIIKLFGYVDDLPVPYRQVVLEDEDVRNRPEVVMHVIRMQSEHSYWLAFLSPQSLEVLTVNENPYAQCSNKIEKVRTTLKPNFLFLMQSLSDLQFYMLNEKAEIEIFRDNCKSVGVSQEMTKYIKAEKLERDNIRFYHATNSLMIYTNKELFLINFTSQAENNVGSIRLISIAQKVDRIECSVDSKVDVIIALKNKELRSYAVKPVASSSPASKSPPGTSVSNNNNNSDGSASSNNGGTKPAEFRPTKIKQRENKESKALKPANQPVAASQQPPIVPKRTNSTPENSLKMIDQQQEDAVDKMLQETVSLPNAQEKNNKNNSNIQPVHEREQLSVSPDQSRATKDETSASHPVDSQVEPEIVTTDSQAKASSIKEQTKQQTAVQINVNESQKKEDGAPLKSPNQQQLVLVEATQKSEVPEQSKKEPEQKLVIMDKAMSLSILESTLDGLFSKVTCNFSASITAHTSSLKGALKLQTSAFEKQLNSIAHDSLRKCMAKYIESEFNPKLEKYFQEVFRRANDTYDMGKNFALQRLKSESESLGKIDSELVLHNLQKLEEYANILQNQANADKDQGLRVQLQKIKDQIRHIDDMMKKSYMSYGELIRVHQSIDRKIQAQLERLRQITQKDQGRKKSNQQPQREEEQQAQEEKKIPKRAKQVVAGAGDKKRVFFMLKKSS